MRRRRAVLIERGATVEGTKWSIPIPALIATGLMPATTAPDARHDELEVTPSDAQLAAMREELNEWRRRAEVAEALADERRAALERADLALRALTAAPPVTSRAPIETASVTKPEAPPEDEEPGFFRRLFG